MTKKVSKTELALIAAWAVLLIGSPNLSEGLLFNWPIKAHIAVLGTLLVGSMIVRRIQPAKN